MYTYVPTLYLNTYMITPTYLLASVILTTPCACGCLLPVVFLNSLTNTDVWKKGEWKSHKVLLDIVAKCL